jgi:hypothetical protein
MASPRHVQEGDEGDVRLQIEGKGIMLSAAVNAKIDVITNSDAHTDELKAITFTIHYPNGSAQIHVVIDGPRSKELSRSEVVRLEIQGLIDALQKVAVSSKNIRVAERRS